jgi:hypothetical protein
MIGQTHDTLYLAVLAHIQKHTHCANTQSPLNQAVMHTSYYRYQTCMQRVRCCIPYVFIHQNHRVHRVKVHTAAAQSQHSTA